MIHYEPHPHWLRDIARLPSVSVVRKSILSSLLVGTFAALLITLLNAVPGLDLPHGAAAFSVFGGLTSVALGFRLNNAKNRWWEGRMHWGLLVNHSRNLAALGSCLIPSEDEEGRRRLAGLLGDFAIGLSSHLRGGVDLAELRALTPEERSEAAGREHPLSFVASLLWAEIENRRRQGNLDTAQVLQLQPHARALLDVLGACERIRKTPIPFAATAAIRALLLGFSLFIPFGLHAEFGWLGVPVAVTAHFVLATMDKLAAELEDPFGSDPHDLPTRSIAEAIRRQAHEVVGTTRTDDATADTQPIQLSQYQLVH